MSPQSTKSQVYKALLQVPIDSNPELRLEPHPELWSYALQCDL